jgi:hypothetical protein
MLQPIGQTVSIVWEILGLFNAAFSNKQPLMKWGEDYEWWVDQDLDNVFGGPISNITDQEMLKEITKKSVMIAGNPIKIPTRQIPNISQR